MNLPQLSFKPTKPLQLALPLQGMPAWMFAQTPCKVAFCNMNVHAPETDNDDDDKADEADEADEADDEDEKDEEPSSPE